MNNDYGTDFAKILYKIRLEFNLTQKQIAELIHVSDRTISKWERGISVPDLVSIKMLCEALEVSPSFLFNDKKTFKDHINSIKRKINKLFNLFLHNFFNILFIIVFLILLIRFVDNYNKFKFHIAKYESKNITINHGYLIETKDLNIFTLSDISLKKIDYEPKKIRLEVYTFINGDRYTIYNGNDLDDIYIEELKSYPIVFTKDAIKEMKRIMYMDVCTTNDSEQEECFNSVISLHDNLKNNIIYKEDGSGYDISYTENKDTKPLVETANYKRFNILEATYDFIQDNSKISIDKAINKLSKLGYSYDIDTNSYKKINDDGTVIQYWGDLKIIKYEFVDKYYEIINYNFEKGIIDIFQSDKDEQILNMRYSIKLNKTLCKLGNCENYQAEIDKILSIYEEIMSTLYL